MFTQITVNDAEFSVAINDQPTIVNALTLSPAVIEATIQGNYGFVNEISVGILATVTVDNVTLALEKTNGLIINGAGQLGTNAKWPGTTFDFAHRPFGADGAFATTLNRSDPYSDVYYYADLIKIAPTAYYELNIDVMQLNELPGRNSTVLIQFFCHDRDGNKIRAQDYMPVPGQSANLALAADLHVGDTTFTVNNIAGFADNVATANWYTGGLAFFPYTGADGFVYKKEEIPYSRYSTPANLWGPSPSVILGNTITLKNPWSYANPNRPDGVWLAGTEILNTMGLSPAIVLAADNALQLGVYKHFKLMFGGKAGSNKFLPGTASVQFCLDNYLGKVGENIVFSNVSILRTSFTQTQAGL